MRPLERSYGSRVTNHESRSSDSQKMLPVVPQFVDRLMYVCKRFVFALFGQTAHQLRPPASNELFQRADIEISVEEILFESRHVAHEKAPVLVHGIAAQR